MEEVRLIGTEAVSRSGVFKFPDNTERVATQRTKFEGNTPIVEIAEALTTDRMRFTMTGELFQQLVDAAKALVTEIRMSFGPDGMETKFIDSAHVAMFMIKVPRAAFIEYDLGMRYLVVSVDVERLKALKIKKSTGVVTLDMDGIQYTSSTATEKVNDIRHAYVSLEYYANRMAIRFGNAEQKVTLLDNNTVMSPKIPKIETGSYAVVQTSDIREFLNMAASVSDSARFTLTRDGLEMLAKSDSEETRVMLAKDMLKEIRMPDKVEKIKSSYPLEYLAKTFSAVRKPGEARISFKDDYPMQVEFAVENPRAPVSVVFLLAPRMEQ